MIRPTRVVLPVLTARVIACLLTLLASLLQAQALQARPLPVPSPSLAYGEDAVERRLGGDLFVAGGILSISSPVSGDLIAAGADIDVAAEIGDDAVIAGANVRLGAALGDGLYAAAGRIVVNGPVQRNVRVAGGRVETGPAARIGGNVTIGAGDVRIAGAVDGYLQVVARRVFIDGSVAGNVEVAAGVLELGPNARIVGDLRYASPDALRLDPAAQVQGAIERYTPPADWPAPSQVRTRLVQGLGWIWSVGMMTLAAVLILALPRLFVGVGATLRARWPMALLAGFVALVCIPAAALLVMSTVIGAPLALVMLALYFALLLVGYASTGIAIGASLLLRSDARAAHTGWRLLAAVLGVLVLSLLARLPWVGWISVLAATLLGIGALLITLNAMRRV